MSRLRRWLRPGTGVSGWLVVVFLGELLLALAGALVIRQLFRDVPANSAAGQAFSFASLQFLPDWLRPAVVLAVGVGIFLWGLRRLVGVLLEPFPAHTQPLVELVYQKRSLARGRRIVAIGGGTGQSTLLARAQAGDQQPDRDRDRGRRRRLLGQAARGAGHRARR